MIYQDTLFAARDLLGKILYRRINGQILSGIIVETEAYLSDDPACHAFMRQTPRNQWMFGPAGTAYIHINYGIHYCLNVVTSDEGVGEAVLIRAIEPLEGVDTMKRLRKKDILKELTNGPGKLTQALGIDLRMNGVSLSGKEVWIEDGRSYADDEVVVTTRIGITKGADLPYRFYVKNNSFVSKK